MINIDITTLYQIAVYFILLLVLNKFLYQPIRAKIEERKAHTEVPLEDAAMIESDVTQGLIDYEKNLKDATGKAQEERVRVRQEAAGREREILDEARAEAATELTRIGKEIEASKDEAFTTLKGESAAFSKDIAAKIIGRTLSVALITAIALFSTLFLTDAAQASEGASVFGGAWKVGNFVVLVIGIYFVWKKVLKVMLDKRAEEIRASIAEAERVKGEAEAKLSEYREKVSGLDAKVESIRKRLAAEAAAEKARIIEEAGLQAKRLAEQAKTAAEQEIKKARIAIRNEVAELAIEAARELIGRELKDEDQERITKEYLERLRIN